MIRDAYRAHEDAIIRSGTFIEIELSNFALHPLNSLGRVLWRDIHRASTPERIRIYPKDVLASGGRLLGTAYAAKLVRLPEAFAPTDSENWTVAELLDRSLEEDGLAPSPIAAVVSFDVLTRIGLSELHYRSAVRWTSLPGPESSGAFTVADPVMDFLPELLEKPNVHSESNLYRLLGASEEVARREAMSRAGSPEAACVVDSEEYSYPVAWKIGSYNHATGNCTSRAQASATCSCDSACTSTVVTRVSDVLCEDSGQVSGLTLRHYARIRDYSENSLVANALSSGAKGTAVWGCFMQQCSWFSNNCSASITFNPQVFPVTATVTGGSIVFDGSISFAFECGACTTRQPDPLPRGVPNAAGRGPFHLSPEPGPGGGAGGYTGPSCLGTMTCRPQFLTGRNCGSLPSPCLVEVCDVAC
ncbi:MAG TPA: hypothetical protein VLF66_04040 [Thermoanaerobaculia bacterium]|nr:hypothetical protein [Thermoanaerobaculia bacterium]